MEDFNKEILQIFNNLTAIREEGFLEGVVGEERVRLLEKHVRDVFRGIYTEGESISQPDLYQFFSRLPFTFSSPTIEFFVKKQKNHFLEKIEF